MHESTVSRVTTNKYVQTPRGVFELKYFFSSGLATEEGDDVSAKVAKDKILTLINNEDKREPLSDQRVAEILHEQGLRIARRTVAKYRERLLRPPARATPVRLSPSESGSTGVAWRSPSRGRHWKPTPTFRNTPSSASSG
jgi:DNA-directed RNA polymerase specialized sigma54-like protein